MPGEGERGEGRENPEKDPFASYAEELERKQKESAGSDEPDRGIPEQNASPGAAAETPKAEGEIGQDEFEAYAKDLREKYAEDEGGTGSSEVSQTSSGADAEVPSQERRVPKGLGERELDDSARESAGPNPRQNTDSTATDSSSTSVDKKGNDSDSTDGTNDSAGRPANPVGSNVRIGSQPDKPILNDTDPSAPTPTETDPMKRQNSARTNGQPHDNQKDSINLDSQQAADSPANDEPKSIDIGSYQPKANNGSKALDKQVTFSSAEDPKVSQPDKPSSKKQLPISPEAKPNLDNPPKADQTTGGNSKGFPIRGQRDLDSPDNELRQKLQPSNEPHSNDSLKTKQQEEFGSAIQDLNPKPGIPEIPGAAPGSSDPKGTGYSQTARNEVYTRYNPYESKIIGNIDEPKAVPIVLAGKWESRGTYFLIRKSQFEELTGTRLEIGKTYEIHYRIEGVGGTWNRFSQTENHATRPSIYLRVGQSFRDKLRLGTRYGITIDHVTDKRCLRVTKTHQGPAFRIYRHYLGSMGYDNPQVRQEKNPVVEIGVRNLSSKEQREVKCYTTLRFETHKPSYNVCMILVKGLGAKFGDIMEVQYVKRQTIYDFTQKFNGHQPKNLENVHLGLDQDKLSMKVDKREVQLENPRLSTNKLQVCLRASLEQTGKMVYFWFDGEHTRMSFLQKWPVLSLTAGDSGIDISYRMGPYKTPTFRFRTEKFDINRFRDELKLLSTPEYPGDSYIFRVSPELQDFVRLRLKGASGPFDARCEKGDISEEIQRHLLTALGQWKEVEYHPFDKAWRTHESTKRGPDSVQRSKSTGELGYFEFRWSTDAYQAYFNCRRQALDDLKKWPTYKEETVKTAYVGTLEWDVRKTSLNFYVKEAAPENIGHNVWNTY